MVEMFPVASSRISEMGYDAETATVYVRFTDGRSWCYMNIPQDVCGSVRSFIVQRSIIKETLDAYQPDQLELEFRLTKESRLSHSSSSPCNWTTRT